MNDNTEREAVRQQLIDDLTDNPDDWEVVGQTSPAPPGSSTPKVTVALRLDADVVDAVQQIAAREGIGYTTLLRGWIEDRVHGRHAQPTHLGTLQWQYPREKAARAIAAMVADAEGDTLAAAAIHLSRLTPPAAPPALQWLTDLAMKARQHGDSEAMAEAALRILELAILGQHGIELAEATAR